MKNIIVVICSLFSLFSYAKYEAPVEVPIYRAVLTEVHQGDTQDDNSPQYVLTMYKLVNSSTHPSSFTLCLINQEQSEYCDKFFLTKEKEPLRCHMSRFTALENRRAQSIVVDESTEDDTCNGDAFASIDESRLVWNVRTYIDGSVDKTYIGFPEAVR